MKVLFTVTKSEAGGAQTHVYQMAKALRDRGHEARVMARPHGWLDQAAKDENIGFYPNPYFSNELRLLRDWQAGARLLEVVGQFQPDLISCHSSKAGFVTRLAIRGKIPTVFTAHGWGFAERGPIASRLMFIPAEILAARYTKKIICVSNYVRTVAEINRIAPREKLVVIHNGAEAVSEDSKDDRNPVEPLGILFVGRLVSQKDPETLVLACAGLPGDTLEKMQLRIIGDGDKREKLEKNVQTYELGARIEFFGSMDRGSVLRELKQGDVFVLTTHYEGLPRTAIEAMHAGLPIIASDVWGVRELFNEQGETDENQIGILVREGDVLEVRDALARLINNEQLRMQMGRAARYRARQSFSCEKMIQDTIQVYEEVLH